MSESIVLKKSPKVEFQIMENGFQLYDEQSKQNTGFYSYDDLQSVELQRAWFPRLSRWMRIITTITNGVPFFPDADSYKLASIRLHFSDSKIGMWLTDIKMARSAKMLKESLDKKTNRSHS